MSSRRQTSPTVRRRRLGAELRRLREPTGLTSYDVAKRLGWSSNSKVSRIENGRISCAWGDVSDMLDLYGIGAGDTRDRLIALARESKEKGWWQPFNDLLSKDYATLIDLEAAASRLWIYQSLAVPGLLQTDDYARALITRSGPVELDEAEVERRVELRLHRQGVVAEDDGLDMWVVLDEAALHRMIGGPAVMRAQLAKLAQAARSRRVTIQVIPFAAGPHASLAGSVGIFGFSGPDDPDVVYIETIAGNLFLEREADLRQAAVSFDFLRATALSVAASLDMIESIAKTYE